MNGKIKISAVFPALLKQACHIGQKVKILPSNQEASVEDIILYEDHLKSAEKGQAVTNGREVDVSRGDVIVPADMPCELQIV